MNERIKKIRKNSNLTQQEFANKLGISRGNIAAYEVGKNAPSDAAISLICEKFNINESWLRNGKEPMYVEKDGSFTELLSDLDDSDDDFIKSLIKAYMALDEDSKNALRKIANGMVEKYKKKRD